MQIPVEKNKIYTFEIIDINHEGVGIAKIEGFAIFVHGAMTGDTVKAKVISTKKNYAVALTQEIIKPSEDRIDPICPAFEECGGCQIMNMKYEKQLQLKTKTVINEMKRNRVEYKELYETIGMKEPYHYRNKAQFPVSQQNGKLSIGFYKKKSHDIVDLDTCYIQHQSNDELIQIIREYILKYNIPVYDEYTHKGLLRHILTKVSFRTGEIMLVLIINGKALPYSDMLIQMLTEKMPNIKSINLSRNEKKTNVILGDSSKCIYGEPYLKDYIGDLEFIISPESFFQVNPIQTEVLYGKALEFAELTGEEIVYDIYCGAGTISLFLAQKAKYVYGIEVVPEAIENAKINAANNNISNVEFHAGTAEEVFPKLYSQGKTADIVVVDPPRKGCDQQVLDTIIEMSPKKIVYVSCGPASLARDLKYLQDNGYKIDKIQPVDMFSHSTHVETAILMTRSDSGEKK